GNPPAWTPGTVLTQVRLVLQTDGRLLLSTLQLALVTGVLTAALALLACWLATGRRWFRLGVLVLMAAAWALPGPVIGIGRRDVCLGLTSWSNSETVGPLLHYGPSYVPVYWACLLRFFPCAAAVLWPVIRLLPVELRDAARVDGASPGQELRHVVWPLAGL